MNSEYIIIISWKLVEIVHKYNVHEVATRKREVNEMMIDLDTEKFWDGLVDHDMDLLRFYFAILKRLIINNHTYRRS